MTQFVADNTASGAVVPAPELSDDVDLEEGGKEGVKSQHLTLGEASLKEADGPASASRV